MDTSDTRYNVVCVACGDVFTPAVKSPLWWKAKQHADKGHLDAVGITGEACGCVKKPHSPDSPFRVFGYDDACHDFDIPCGNFVGAVRKFLELNRDGMNVVFISGVSVATQRKLAFA